MTREEEDEMVKRRIQNTLNNIIKASIKKNSSIPKTITVSKTTLAESFVAGVLTTYSTTRAVSYMGIWVECEN